MGSYFEILSPNLVLTANKLLSSKSGNMAHPTDNKTLKEKVFWHLKVIAGTIFITLVFSIFLRHELLHDSLPEMLLFTFVQLELFIWLGMLFFQSIKIEEANYARRMVWRLVVFYVSVLGIAFIMFLGIFTVNFIKTGTDFSQFFPNLTALELKTFFLATLIGFAFGAIFFFYSQWSEALKRMQKLKEEKLIFQYETLKSQVNPHFLFNSLNTLSSLVSKDVELSEKFILKLSSVYRYVLENQEKDLVPVSEELKFMNDFYYLQKIRDGEKTELKVELKDEHNMKIVPVSLQMLVDNALKHNVATRREPLLITIHLEGLDKLVVRNDLREKTQLINSSKIGLKNLNERCSLILKREIEVLETNDEFVVKVPVKLNRS